MSSTGAIPTNTAPLVLRVDPDNPLSVNNTFVLDKLGNPVPSGSVQLIAPLGQIVYGNALSTLTVSSLNAPNHAASTLSVTSTLNLNNSASIIFNNITNSNRLSTIGNTLYFNGQQVAIGAAVANFWQDNDNVIVNINDGPVSTTKNLIVAGEATINGIINANNGLNITTGGATITGNQLLYTCSNPTNLEALKVELSGANLCITKNGTSDTCVYNGSGGNLILSTNQTVSTISNADITGYLSTHNNAFIGGNLSATGSVTINNGLNITSGGATINGLLTSNNGILTIQNANINGYISTQNNVFIGGNLSTIAGATINGLLTSNNAINVTAGGATINGLLTANNGASTIGNHTVTGTLYANTPTFYNNSQIFNSGVTSSSASLSLNTGNGGYTMYTTTSQGSPSTSGLTPSTLQIYSYYGPNPNARNVLTIYPGGRTDVLSTLNVTTGGANITGPTNINGTLATSTIQMTNGVITGVNTINGVVFPPTSQGNLPVGSIIMWNGAALDLPSGFALCDGGTYNIPGGTTRVTPDLRGRFIMGATYATSGTIRYNGSTGPATLPVDENGVTVPALYTNQTGGEINHTLTIAEMPSHNHPYTYREPLGGTVSDFYSGSYWSPTTVNSNTSNTGGGQSHNNIPQYYVLAFIMRIF